MSTAALERELDGAGEAVELAALGPLRAISRAGGQGRVHEVACTPPALGPTTVVAKLYRAAPPRHAADVLADMVAWSRRLDADERARLGELCGWPLATVTQQGELFGILMHDLRPRFEAPFQMPSGARAAVLLALEHLLGADDFLLQRGLDVRLDTRTRAEVLDRIASALAFLHRHAIVADDVSPNNVLVRFEHGVPEVCLIDCDSMSFRGRQALTAVETGDWNLPTSFAEPAHTRAADAYKLGLVALRLFARSHDARDPEPHLVHVPAELRGLLRRALAPDPPNRPPAGEWHRALREVLLGGELVRRYPGPVRSPRRPGGPPAGAAGRADDVRRPAHRGPGVRIPAVAPAALAVPPLRARSRTLAGAGWGSTIVSIVAVATIAFLIAFGFLHALRALEPSTPSAGGDGFAPAQPYYQQSPYYYVPQGGGQPVIQ